MVGESQSNGLAERAMQTVEGQLKCMKLALEDRLQCSIPCSHPIMSWVVEYAAMLINKYQPSGDDAITRRERLHGQPANERLQTFGNNNSLGASKQHAWQHYNAPACRLTPLVSTRL